MIPNIKTRTKLVFAIIIAWTAALALSACTPDTGTADGRDPFLLAVYEAYPLLKDRPYDTAKVKRVVDGDTFETADGDRVRLIGVDTPEVHGRTEHFGAESSAFSKKRLTGKNVYLFKDVSETDRYGRLLRYVFVEDEPRMFNETLVLEGYATVMTYPPDVLFAERFVEAEREAREGEVGLWAAQGTEAPAGATPGCPEPAIKGNINSRGEKIYHVPGGRYYEQTKAEEMFCTEQEAEAAGYRPVKTQSR